MNTPTQSELQSFLDAMNLPTQSELQSFLDALTPDGSELDLGDGPKIGPWKVAPGVIFTDGFGNRQSCVLEAPSVLDPRSACLVGPQEWYGPDVFRALFWDEIWDGTIDHIRDIFNRSTSAVAAMITEPHVSIAGTMIPAGGMGYGVVTLERDWGIEGYVEDCNRVAVLPALLEFRNKSVGNDLNVGLDEWIEALDKAQADSATKKY
jgi:hypothetical protein